MRKVHELRAKFEFISRGPLQKKIEFIEFWQITNYKDYFPTAQTDKKYIMQGQENQAMKNFMQTAHYSY